MQIRGIVQRAELVENPPGSDRIEMVLWGQGVGPNKPRSIVVPYELLLQDPSLDPDQSTAMDSRPRSSRMKRPVGRRRDRLRNGPGVATPVRIEHCSCRPASVDHRLVKIQVTIDNGGKRELLVDAPACRGSQVASLPRVSQ